MRVKLLMGRFFFKSYFFHINEDYILKGLLHLGTQPELYIIFPPCKSNAERNTAYQSKAYTTILGANTSSRLVNTSFVDEKIVER